MKIEGSQSIKAPRELLFDLMTDPEALSRCMPGAESLEETEPGVYKLTLKTGVGTIKGSYNASIRLEDIRDPEHYKMVVEGKGAPGFVKGTGTLDLSEQDEMTVINYSGDVTVGGTIASVGQRMVLSTAKMMTSHYFAALEAEVKAILRAQAAGEEVKLPKHSLLRNTFRATKGFLSRKRSNDQEAGE